jgi:hypothetical protein
MVKKSRLDVVKRIVPFYFPANALPINYLV